MQKRELKEDIEKLLKYLPIFQRDDFNPIDEEKCKDSDIPFMLCYTSEVQSFIDDFYKSDLVYSFDWSKWQDEAIKYVNNPNLIENVDIQTIQKLLTLHMRKERFCEGHLIDMIDNGHIVALLRRLKAIN